MLLSKEVPELGRVHYPLGGGVQFDDLITEIDEYFRHGIRLSPGDVVFDVGANIGAFALSASRHAGGALELYCFEPIPPVFQALERNLTESPMLGAVKKRLFQVGLTSFDGPTEAVFHYFKRLPCDTTQHIDEKREEFAAFFRAKGQRVETKLGGTLPGGLGRTLGAWASTSVSRLADSVVSGAVFDRLVGTTQLHCPLTTIDDIVKKEGVSRIDLLKVDVEGAELDVLLGIGPSTWPLVRQVVMEGHDKEGRLDRIKGLLHEAGFSFVSSEVPQLAVERGLNNFILHARR